MYFVHIPSPVLFNRPMAYDECCLSDLMKQESMNKIFAEISVVKFPWYLCIEDMFVMLLP